MIADLKPYPNYKESGELWLGKVPEHWEMLPNRALFKEVEDRDFPDEEMLSVTITRGVIRQKDLLKNSTKKDSSNLDKTLYKLVTHFDIVYNKMRAWQGAIGVSEYRGIVSPAYVVVRPKNICHPPYLHYLFRTPQFAKEAERWSYGITSDMWSLRPEHFKLIYSCLPPKDEQLQIVRFLDYMERRIRRYISAKQKLIKLLEEQKQVIINKVVTRGLDPNVRLKPSGVEWLGDVPEHWDVRRLRYAVSLRVSNVDKHSVEGELPIRLCNYIDVYKNDEISSNIQFMFATVRADELESFGLKAGDVVMTKDSEDWRDIGVSAYVADTLENLVCGYHLAILRPIDGGPNGRFIHCCLLSKGLKNQLSVRANGVTRFGLSQGAIKDTLINVPPIHEQDAIVTKVFEDTRKITSSITSAYREIDLLHEYRTRLIADVVTGKLDVREIAAQLPDEFEEEEIIDDEVISDDEAEEYSEDSYAEAQA